MEASGSCRLKSVPYLSEDKIQIAELIYTIVLHRIHTSELETTDFGVILITLNGEWCRNKDDAYCELTDCVAAGFGKIRPDSEDPEPSTFCCAFNVDNLSRLKIEYEKNTTMRPLNLNSFYADKKAFEDVEYVFEVKCPFKYRNDDLYEVFKSDRKSDYIVIVHDDEVVYNTDHLYYHQIQAHMCFTNCSYAILIIWSTVNSITIKIPKDTQWVNNLSLLPTFYFETFLPYVLKEYESVK